MECPFDGIQEVRGVGVDFRPEVVVDVNVCTGTAGAADRRIGRMLVGPGRVASCAMYYSVNRVDADKIPRIDRVAIRVAFKPGLIDRVDPAVAGRSATVEKLLIVLARANAQIDVDGFLVFRGRTEGDSSGHARAG